MGSRPVIVATLVSAAAIAALAVVFFRLQGSGGRPGEADERVTRSGRKPLRIVMEPPGGGGSTRANSADKVAAGAAVPPRGDGDAPVPPAGEDPSRPGPERRVTRGKLVVLVEADSGGPASGLTVRVDSGRATFPARTDPEGRAVFESLPVGSYGISLEGAAAPPTRMTRRVDIIGGRTRELRLVLGSFDLAIGGIVQDSAGQPLEGVTVEASPMEGAADEFLLVRADTSRKALTDGEGRFRVADLAAGEYVLATVPIEGYSAARRNVTAPAEEVPLVLHEERLLVVHGSVTDPEGNAIAGARLSCITHGGSVTTDAAGTYHLEIAMKADSRWGPVVRAEKQRYVRQEKRLPLKAMGDENTVELLFVLEEVEGLGVVVGRLVDTDERPVAGEQVYLRSPSLNVRYHALSGADGSFRMSDVRGAADYRLWVYPRRRYRDRSVSPIAIEARENSIEIVLEPIDHGVLSGVVLDAEGQPLPRFHFRIRSRESLGNFVLASTDPEGRFRIEGVPAGELIIETRAAPNIAVHGIRLEADREGTVEVPVGTGSQTVSGSVVSRDGTPIAAARVLLSWSGMWGKVKSSLLQEAVTDQQGHFVIRGIGPGSCSLNLSAPGYRASRTPFEIRPSAGAPELRVELEPE